MNPMSCQSFIPATIVVVCMTLGLGGWAPEAAADAPDGPLECIAPVQELDAYRLMRRLSLDLRNHLPTWEELDALGDSATELPDEVIDEYLQSDAFRIVARRFHADLLWPTAQPSKLTIPPFHLTERGGSGSPYDIQGAAGAKRRRAWRGDPDIYCADVEQTEWIEVEGPVAYRTPVPINTWEEDGRTIRQDGYVWVRPYWDPSTEVRVCAYVAQEAEVVPQLDDEGEVVIDNRPGSPSRGEPRLASCIEGEGIIDELCGCGPGLRTCFGPGVENAVKDAIRDQLLRLVDDHTVYGEPYSEMLTTSRTYMNGTLQFWYRHLAMSTSLNREFNRYGLGEALLPDGPVDFTDGTWVARGWRRSGTLTKRAQRSMQVMRACSRCQHTRCAFRPIEVGPIAFARCSPVSSLSLRKRRWTKVLVTSSPRTSHNVVDADIATLFSNQWLRPGVSSPRAVAR